MDKWTRSHEQDGKQPLNIFFSRTSSPMNLKLGMQHWGLKHYKVYINDDPGLNLTYFTAMSVWSPMCLNGGNRYKVIKEVCFQQLADFNFLFIFC